MSRGDQAVQHHIRAAPQQEDSAGLHQPCRVLAQGQQLLQGTLGKRGGGVGGAHRTDNPSIVVLGCRVVGGEGVAGEHVRVGFWGFRVQGVRHVRMGYRV